MGQSLALIQERNAITPHFGNASRSCSPAFFGKRRRSWLLEIDVRMPSQVEAISSTVEQLMQMIAPSRCLVGNEFAVELALREALNNAVVHGNQMDRGKLVEIHCRCDGRRGVWLLIKDQGEGFNPDAVPDPLGPAGLKAEHGRGIYLMKLLMDEVWFEAGGTEVHMWKAAVPHSSAEVPTRQLDDVAESNGVVSPSNMVLT
jgi:serine/threonine-protein kinase RsbW